MRPKKQGIMRRATLSIALGVLCLFCFSQTARAYATIPITGHDTACIGAVDTYRVASYPGGVTYVWTVTPQGYATGSGNTAVVSWGAAGTATLHVYVFDSTGVDTIAKGTATVLIVPLPNPYITDNSSVACQSPQVINQKGEFYADSGCINVCANTTVVYTAHDVASSHYHWAVTGATSFTATGATCTVHWGASGTGNITLTDTSVYGCISTLTLCYTIIPIPTAHFYTKPDSTTAPSLTICDSTILNFISNSTSPGSPIISWYWDFGDGSSSTADGSTDDPVTHEFDHPGTYPVFLTVTDACGCSNTYQIILTVTPKPGVKISCPSVICQNDTGTYSVDSHCGTYSWSQTGGHVVGSSTGPTFVVVWDAVDTSGFGYVSFNSAGCPVACPGIATAKIPVIEQTGHISGPTSVCSGTSYTYILPEWPSTVFNWNISSTGGDATTTATDQPNKIVVNTGSTLPSTITLTCNYINTLLGCGGLATITINVLPPATITPEVTKMCLNSSQIFTLSGGTGSFSMTFPDHTVHPSGSPATYIFSEVGTYTLSVIGSLCPPSPEVITVDSLPHPPDSIVGPSIACKGVPITYTGASALAGTVFEWAAVGGTVSPASGPTTNVTFSGTGPFKVLLWRDEAAFPNCPSDTIIKVIDTPVVLDTIHGLDTVCPSSYELYNATYGDGETYAWSIFPGTAGSVSSGDGTDTVNVLWNNEGATGATADLIVKVRKCTTFYSDTLKVWIRGVPHDTIKFSVGGTFIDSICEGYPFTASLSPSGGGIVNWDFGDGTTAMGAGYTVTHHYGTPVGGNVAYTVTATVINEYGCHDTVSFHNVIWVKPSPVANITPDGPFNYCDTTSIHIPLTATISTGYGATDSLYWMAGTTVLTSCAGLPPPCVTWTANHIADYYVIAVNSNGCRSSSNVVDVNYHCDTAPPPPCSAGTPPVLAFDTVTHVCGVVHLHATHTGSTIVSTSWGWPIPQAQGVVTTSNDLDCYFLAAGLYTFEYDVTYTNGTDTCVEKLDTTFIIPLIPGLNHEVTCAPAGAGYTVVLLDNSNYYPGTTFTEQFQINSGAHVGSYPSYTTTLTPGSYGLHDYVMWTYGTSSGTCEGNDAIVLPALPVANFSVSIDSPCIQDTAVMFTNLSTPTGLTAFWDFGDLSTNSLYGPVYRVYTTLTPSASKRVTLTVTNIYGCTSTFFDTIRVQPNGLIGGGLSVLPSSPCAGTAVTLTYSGGSTTPQHYEWFDNSTEIGYTTINTFHVYTTGVYWVDATNHFGCNNKTSTVSVNYSTPPPAFINGDTSACSGVNYTLSAYTGAPGVTYVWLSGGVVVSSGLGVSSYTDNEGIGVYTYQVITQVVNPGGGICSDTSPVFHVRVFDYTPAPTVTATITNCGEYTVKLTATDVSPGGVYNWSNGGFGASINVHDGGSYQVTYTDTNGCTASTIVVAPQGLQSYMWEFPIGCYDFCSTVLPRTITGPYLASPPITGWTWLRGGVPVAAGTGPVTSYSVTVPGNYQLVIRDAACFDTSGIMSITLDTNCNSTDCRNIAQPSLSIIHDSSGTGCKDTMVISFTNTTGGTLPYDISAINGMLIPSTGTMATGSSTVKFRYVLDAGSSATSDTIKIVIHTPTGDCIKLIPIQHFHPCPNSFAPRWTDTTGQHATQVTSSLATLVLAPNPAANSAKVMYAYGDAGHAEDSRSIVVYSMDGRVVERHAVMDAEGVWLLQLGNYVPGVYIVALEENGKVLLQSRLSIMR